LLSRDSLMRGLASSVVFSRSSIISASALAVG
jgi:hypothetical protein